MTSAITTARKNLGLALMAPGRVIYANPRENMSVPCLVLRPASVWIDPSAVSTSKPILNFDLTAVVSMNDDDAAVAQLEQLITDAMAALPANTAIASWDGPRQMTVGPNNYLASQAMVSIRVTT